MRSGVVQRNSEWRREITVHTGDAGEPYSLGGRHIPGVKDKCAKFPKNVEKRAANVLEINLEIRNEGVRDLGPASQEKKPKRS